MRKIAFGLVILGCLTFIACGNADADINAFTTDFDKLTNDIVAKIKAMPTAAGIDEAQKMLDGKRADMKTKFDGLKQLGGFQVSKDSTKKLTDSLKKDLTTINSLKIDYMDKTMSDKDFSEKLNKLVVDFNTIGGI